MITADILARELGCTLADLEDLGGLIGTLKPEHMIYNMHADRLREAWIKREGIDSTKRPESTPPRPDRVAAQSALNKARDEYVKAWRKLSSKRLRVRRDYNCATPDVDATEAANRRRAMIKAAHELRDAESKVLAAELDLAKVLAS